MIRAVLFLVVAAVIWYLVRAALSRNRYVPSGTRQEIDDQEPEPGVSERSGRDEASKEEAREARFRDL